MKVAKVPGSADPKRLDLSAILPDVRAIKLGVDNNRMTALVAALIDAGGGEVTLTKEQSERVWDSPKIKYVRTPTGGLSLSLEGYTPTHPPENTGGPGVNDGDEYD